MSDLPEVVQDLENEEIDTPIGSIKVKFFKISDENLDDALDRQASDLVYFASWEAAAKKSLAQLEQEIAEREAEIYTDLKKRKEAGEKSLTNPVMEQMVEKDEEIQRLKRERIDVEHQLNQFQLLRRAKQEQGKMIQSKVGLSRSKIEESIEMSRSANALNRSKEESNE